jgi:hypothetical protein
MVVKQCYSLGEVSVFSKIEGVWVTFEWTWGEVSVICPFFLCFNFLLNLVCSFINTFYLSLLCTANEKNKIFVFLTPLETLESYACCHFAAGSYMLVSSLLMIKQLKSTTLRVVSCFTWCLHWGVVIKVECTSYIKKLACSGLVTF